MEGETVMTTTVTKQQPEAKQQPAETRKPGLRDPLALMRDEWQRFLSNFEQNGGLFTPPSFLTGISVPTLDLGETDKTLELRMDLPGMAAEDIDIQLNDNTITISGERKEEREEKGKTWQRLERHQGEFSRTVTLPCAVKNNEVSAVYRDGVLAVTLPKSAQAQTRKVAVHK